MTYGEFVNNSTFGCPDCYDVFGPLISDTIKRIQGSDHHVGKKPMLYGMSEPKDGDLTGGSPDGSVQDLKKELDFLSKKLKEAVSEENFTEAARLRDVIAGLKGKDE